MPQTIVSLWLGNTSIGNSFWMVAVFLKKDILVRRYSWNFQIYTMFHASLMFYYTLRNQKFSKALFLETRKVYWSNVMWWSVFILNSTTLDNVLPKKSRYAGNILFEASSVPYKKWYGVKYHLPWTESNILSRLFRNHSEKWSKYLKRLLGRC